MSWTFVGVLVALYPLTFVGVLLVHRFGLLPRIPEENGLTRAERAAVAMAVLRGRAVPDRHLAIPALARAYRRRSRDLAYSTVSWSAICLVLFCLFLGVALLQFQNPRLPASSGALTLLIALTWLFNPVLKHQALVRVRHAQEANNALLIAGLSDQPAGTPWATRAR